MFCFVKYLSAVFENDDVVLDHFDRKHECNKPKCEKSREIVFLAQKIIEGDSETFGSTLPPQEINAVVESGKHTMYQ